MKKRTVRVFAIVLAALMVLSLLPLAAYAQETEAPEEFKIPGFELIDGRLVETEHIYTAEVAEEGYLVDPSEPGDCMTPTTYWRSCGNVNPLTEERCGHSAGAAYEAEMQQMMAEMNSRLAAGEKKEDLTQIAAMMAAEIEARYESYKFEAYGDHQWVEVEAQPATCGSEGCEAFRYCEVCGAGRETAVVIPATGEHNFVDGVCTVCSAEDPNYIAPVEETAEGNTTEGTENGTTEGTEGNTTEGTEGNTTEGAEGNTTEGTEGNTTEGTENGTTEGPENGTAEGTENGTTEGTENGTTEGTENGTTEGTENGTTEGTENGTTEGTENGESEKTENGESEKTENGESEKTENGEPEKTEDSEPEKTENGESEKTEDSEPEKTENGEPEKTENGEPEKTENGEPEKTENGEPEKTENGESEKTENGEPEKTENGESEKTENGESEKTENDQPKTYTGKVSVAQTPASEDVVESFTEAAWGYLGLTSENTVGVSVQNVTPYKEDNTELSDEEIPEEGIDFEMDIPEGFDPENQDIEIYHRNKDGVWEKMQIVDIDLENNKIVVRKVRSFSPFALTVKRLDDQIAIVSRPVAFDAAESVTVTLSVSGGFKPEYGRIALLSSESEKNIVTATVTVDGQNVEDLSGYVFHWIREQGDGSEKEIVGAYSSTYTLTSSDLNTGIICTVREPGSEKEAARSDVLPVRKEVSITFEVRGYGTSTYSYERVGVKEENIPLNNNAVKTVTFLTKDSITVSMTPDTDQGYRFRQIATATPGSQYWNPVRSVNLGNEGNPYNFTVSSETVILIQSDKEKLYNEALPTKGADDDIEKNRAEVLKKLWDMLGFKPAAGLYNYRYITPIWMDDALYMTSKEVAAVGGFDIVLDKPSAATDIDAVELYHYVGDYKTGNWEKVNAAYISEEGKVCVDKFKSFSPFCVVAIPGANITETFNEEGGTVKRESEEITSGSTYTTVKDSVVTYTLTPKQNWAVKSVKFNGTEITSENNTFDVTVSETTNTFEVVFAEIEIKPDALADSVKTALETYADKNGYDKTKYTLQDVTPYWNGTTDKVEKPDLEKSGGIEFALPYPEGVTKTDYIITVVHYDGAWKEVTEGVTLEENQARIKSSDFSPWGILTELKDVTIKFYHETAPLSATYPDMNAKNGKAVKLPDGSIYAKTQGKAFKEWNNKPDGTGDEHYASGASYTPNSGSEDKIYLYAILETGVEITFKANNGTSETKTQLIPLAEETPLEANTFVYSGHTFKQWKLEGASTTYQDRANIVASGPLTLVAEWYDKEEPAAPSSVKTTKSILNYGETLLENQAGVISGTNTNMQVYAGDGKWTTITKAPYTVTEPGTYEIRVKELSPYPPSAATSATVHSYYTEASDPEGPTTYDGKTAYKYTVKLIENNADGTIAERHNTDLNEDVKFLLKYPSGIDGTRYSFKLYHLPGMTEVSYETKTEGIISSSKEFSEFLLVIDDNQRITFKGNGGKTSTSKTEYTQYVKKTEDAVLDESLFVYSGYLFNGWKAEGTGKTYADQGTIAKADLTNPITLNAQWIGPVKITGSASADGEDAIVGETLTAAVSGVPTGTKIAYQWVYREPSETVWHFISGETKNTYIPSADYNDKVIACAVTIGDTVTTTTKNAFSNRKTVTNTLTNVYWVQDIINDGNFTTWPSSASNNYAYHTQVGAIAGVKAGMTMQFLPEDSATAQTRTVTADDVKSGYFLTTAPGMYVFSLNGADSDPIVIYDWYTVGFYYTGSTSYSSTGTATSGSGRATMTRTTSTSSNGAMPTTPVLMNGKSSARFDTSGNPLDIMKYSSSVDNVWVIRRSAETPAILTVTPSSGSYAYVSLNGRHIDSFGNARTTTSTTSSSSSTTNASRSYTVNRDANGYWIRMPMMYSIVFTSATTSPRTADESNLGLWSALCMVSLTGAAVILTETRKRRKSAK